MTSARCHPDVSVIIPARNEAAFIGRALASVVAQRWPADALEAIVVANGCTDATSGEVRRFAARHPEMAVRLIETEQPGVGNARNLGAVAAAAPILLFLDADARLTRYCVARAVSMSRSGVEVATYRFLADSNDLLDKSFFWLFELMMTVGRLRSFNFFCRRDLFLEHGGFDPAIKVAEVMDLFRRFRAGGVRVGHTSTVIRTSPRRIRAGPLRLGWLTTFARWFLAGLGIGRRARYAAIPGDGPAAGRDRTSPLAGRSRRPLDGA